MELVSIVIPCYKGARYLPEAIQSCLGQTYRSLEVIVVDDASPDDCAQIAQGYANQDSRIRVVRRKHNGGVSRAFNTGFDVARGRYLSRLAQDDVFRPDAIQRMKEYLESHAEIGLVYCDMQRIDDRGERLDVWPTAEPEQALLYVDNIGLCVMWTREAWETIEPFDPAFDSAEDFEYWLRLKKEFAIGKCTGEPGMDVRFHAAMGSNVFQKRQMILTELALRLHRAEAWTDGNSAGCRAHQDAIAYRNASWHLQEAGEFLAALPCAWRAFRLHPGSLAYWKYLLGACLRSAGTITSRIGKSR
jgi:glycosyltransferase involved in cell wall biosynthesis